jgi:hypothetical protein
MFGVLALHSVFAILKRNEEKSVSRDKVFVLLAPGQATTNLLAMVKLPVFGIALCHSSLMNGTEYIQRMHRL